MTGTGELTATPAPVDDSAPKPTAARAEPSAVDRLLVAWLALLTVAVAVVSIIWLPWRVGSTPVPVSAVTGAALVFLLIRLAYALVPSMRVALLTAGCWLAPTVWLTTTTTAGYGMVIGDWRAQILLGLGALAAAVAVASCWGQHVFGSTVRGVTPGRRGRRH